MVVSSSWCELICFDSMLCGTSYKGWQLGGFPKYLRIGLEYGNQTLRADRHYGGASNGSQEFMTFRIDAAWKRGKVYDFLLSFLTVDFVLALQADAERTYKFCVRIWLQNSKWSWRKWWLYFDTGHILYLVWNLQMEPEVRGTCGCRQLCSLGRADYYAENCK